MNKISRDQSFCFKSVPRDIAYNADIAENKQKLERIYQDGDFKQTISPLVYQELRQDSVEKLVVNETEKEKDLQKMIDHKVLRSMHDVRLSSDNKQNDIKEQLNKLKEWKSLRNSRLRQNKIIHQQYKSGILNVDGPLNQKTQLYQKQKEDILDKLRKTGLNNHNHRDWLVTKQGTHQYIEFSNQNIDQKNDVKVPVHRYDGEVYMQKKKQFGTNYLEYFKDNTNYDGVVKRHSLDVKRQKRKQNLQDQQIRGKNYDIVSNLIINN